jgi:hypothetical protein
MESPLAPLKKGGTRSQFGFKSDQPFAEKDLHPQPESTPEVPLLKGDLGGFH